MSSQQDQNDTAASEDTVKTLDALTKKGFTEKEIREALKIYEVWLHILIPNLIYYFCSLFP